MAAGASEPTRYGVRVTGLALPGGRGSSVLSASVSQCARLQALASR
jgi:hypothetical protein